MLVSRVAQESAGVRHRRRWLRSIPQTEPPNGGGAISSTSRRSD